jgi:hypothetical protein
MTEDKTTASRSTEKDETSMAVGSTAAPDPTTPSAPTDEVLELDDEKVRAISGGASSGQRQHQPI